MRIHEIFSLEPIDKDRHHSSTRRDDVHWHQDISKKDLYNLVTASGKTVKSGLTHAEAKRLSTRPDVKEKFGFLTIEKQ